MARIYARFYYPEFIRDYPDVWGDERLLHAWMHLFIRAEQLWPLPADLPRSVRPKPLAYLVERGLIVVSGVTYEVKGMASERNARRDAARIGAAKRWQSDGNANAHANAMPSKSISRSKSKEIPPPPTSGGRRKDGTNPRANGTSPRQNGHAPRDEGTSPRQERESLKRGPTHLGEILRQAAEASS